MKVSNQLYNKKSKEQLKRGLENESFDRVTLSFYKYVNLDNLDDLRNQLYLDLNNLNILGRVYISYEGINAQVSIPEDRQNDFTKYINSYDELKNVQIKRAIQEGNSFYKLVIKIKDEIVAYGIDDKQYDMDRVGKHLDPIEFNKAIEDPS